MSNDVKSRWASRGRLASYSAHVAPTELGAQTWEELWGERMPSGNDDARAEGAGAKRRIFVSRDYRYLSKPTLVHVVAGLACIAIWAAVMVIFYSPLSLALAQWAGHIVEQACGTPAGIGASVYIPGMGPLHYVTVEGSTPGFAQIITTIVACLIIIVLMAQGVRNTLPVGAYICMGAFLVLVTALFFLFSPAEFPYDLSTYSNLYMEQQIMLWLFVPVVGGVAVFMIDKRPLAATLCFLIIAGVNFTYGCIRYPLYLIALHEFTSMYMAAFFFVLGVLFDFMQMVGVYVIYVYHVSRYMDTFEHKGDWLW